MGSILKDVYLNLDSRTENFETDKNNTKWLEFSFDASKHFYFNRNSSIGGAAISLEVLKKLGLDAKISGKNLDLDDDGLYNIETADAYRYILISDEDVSYLAPSEFKTAIFEEPESIPDFIFIDRSALLDFYTAKKISNFLEAHPETKLILYLKDKNNRNALDLLKYSSLIFCENTGENSELKHAPELKDFAQEKIIYLSENELKYLHITEKISKNRIDLSTHLSTFSIAAATIFGSFLLNNSVEKSLKLARLNLENSRLDATLSLDELKTLDNEEEDSSSNLELIAKSLVLKPKGILAADESGGSIKKKFAQLNIEDTYDNRRDYRNIFFTTPNLEQYVNGVILFDETARQFADDGRNFVDFLTSRRIIPGIKVDGGLEKFENSEETYTKGLDDLDSRLKEYYNMGLRFAKWRAAFEVRLGENGEILTPSDFAIDENCRILAEYALTCQNNNIVPIVEPELVYDGNYDIEKSAFITSKILDNLFAKLAEKNVNLPACILKVNMVLAGKQFASKSSAEKIGEKTAEVLKSHVPEQLAGVVFLSGGQSPEEATKNLASVLANGPFPWPVTFSFARALQDPALYAWNGNNNNTDTAREAFLTRLIANSTALKNSK